MTNFADREPFDPSDPFDAMAESFRTQVCDMAIAAMKVTIYRELPPEKQIEVFLSGVMTGMVGVVFASIDPAGRDYIFEYIGQCLAPARQIAEEILQANT